MLKWGKKGRRAARDREEGDGFWDRPMLLNLVADVLFVLVGLALAYGLVAGVQRLPFFPLRQVVVAGPIVQLSRPQIEHAARTSVIGNFFTVDLEHVRATFETLPWVRHAAVRRLWPDGIEVDIEEQIAAARWRQGEGDSRLVNPYGEVFAAVSDREDLPALAGPDGSAPRLLDEFEQFGRELAPIGRRPQALVMSARQAWQLRLDDGLVLELGRDQDKNTLDRRLARFVAAYPQLQPRLTAPALVDLRYPNGFALRLGRPEGKKS